MLTRRSLIQTYPKNGVLTLKTGLFAKIGIVLLKFAKLIFIGGAAVVAAIVKIFKGKKDNQTNPNA